MLPLTQLIDMDGLPIDAAENGRWDECLAIIRTMLEERPLSASNRMQPLCYQAKVMARRGQDGFGRI